MSLFSGVRVYNFRNPLLSSFSFPVLGEQEGFNVVSSVPSLFFRVNQFPVARFFFFWVFSGVYPLFLFCSHADFFGTVLPTLNPVPPLLIFKH